MPGVWRSIAAMLWAISVGRSGLELHSLHSSLVDRSPWMRANNSG